MRPSSRLAPPLRPEPIDRIHTAFERFLATEAAGGALLLGCAVLALVWANGPWRAVYQNLLSVPLGLGLGPWRLEMPLALWINDGLMAAFFLVVGLEIKREVLVGELASLRRAALPLVAAIGGMLVPAGIYAALNHGGPAAAGWGVPMATDIAFVIGIMALLGPRVPLGLKVFLVALAIVDDLGAVLVIAAFYSHGFHAGALAVAAAVFGLLVLANRSGVRATGIYIVLGLGLWLALLGSGIHATIAGVLLALAIPARPRLAESDFSRFATGTLDRYAQDDHGDDRLSPRQQEAVLAIEKACHAILTPMQRLTHALHPWAVFAIMPVFAIANAGVVLDEGLAGYLDSRATWGVVLGLAVGKPLGIFLCSWLAIRWAGLRLPQGVGHLHLLGAACLGGIGFTMSLFIDVLAFIDPVLEAEAKVGILAGSLVAAVAGVLVLLRARPVA